MALVPLGSVMSFGAIAGIYASMFVLHGVRVYAPARFCQRLPSIVGCSYSGDWVTA